MQAKSIPALARCLDVLRLLQQSGALPLIDTRCVTGIPKASLSRILKTLIEQGFVWQRMVDDGWCPSFALVEMAGRLDRENQLVEAASPVRPPRQPHGL